MLQAKNSRRSASAVNPVCMEIWMIPVTNVGKPSSYHESTPWVVSKVKWYTKEDKGKSMMGALYVLQYVK